MFSGVTPGSEGGGLGHPPYYPPPLGLPIEAWPRQPQNRFVSVLFVCLTHVGERPRGEGIFGPDPWGQGFLRARGGGCPRPLPSRREGGVVWDPPFNLGGGGGLGHPLPSTFLVRQFSLWREAPEIFFGPFQINRKPILGHF